MQNRESLELRPEGDGSCFPSRLGRPEQQARWLAAHPIAVVVNSGKSTCSSQMPEIEKRRSVVRRDACPGEYRAEMTIWVAVRTCRRAMVLCFL